MDLKLVVLAGAKEGTQIPLKKDKFIIGRSNECTLRAGSEAISRRHCAIVRSEDVWVVRDLGSRNGTYLNDQAIKSPTPLKVGDELRVGPLKFRVDSVVKPAADSKAGKRPKAAQSDPHDLNRAKQPPVKDVADAAQRTANKSGGQASEDDISRWLLGADTSGVDSLRETQTLSMEETTTISRPVPAKHPAAAPAVDEALPEDEPDEPVAADDAPDEMAAETGSGGWKFLQFSKKGSKKKPGKLPPRPTEPTKDSREAAADILREMTRRR